MRRWLNLQVRLSGVLNNAGIIGQASGPVSFGVGPGMAPRIVGIVLVRNADVWVFGP